MSKKTFEVKVEGISIEYYEVEADSAEDAKARWADGTLTGTDGHSYGVVSVEEYFEDDDYDPSNDPAYDFEDEID